MITTEVTPLTATNVAKAFEKGNENWEDWFKKRGCIIYPVLALAYILVTAMISTMSQAVTLSTPLSSTFKNTLKHGVFPAVINASEPLIERVEAPFGIETAYSTPVYVAAVLLMGTYLFFMALSFSMSTEKIKSVFDFNQIILKHDVQGDYTFFASLGFARMIVYPLLFSYCINFNGSDDWLLNVLSIAAPLGLASSTMLGDFIAFYWRGGLKADENLSVTSPMLIKGFAFFYVGLLGTLFWILTLVIGLFVPYTHASQYNDFRPQEYQIAFGIFVAELVLCVVHLYSVLGLIMFQGARAKDLGDSKGCSYTVQMLHIVCHFTLLVTLYVFLGVSYGYFKAAGYI